MSLPPPPFAEPSPARPPAPPRAAVRLGEELPIFCEKCGYSLHGLPVAQCDRCTILHFSCPECGHHQPINTLRPAFQRILGRMRAWMLALSVFFKLNFFGWLLFAWVAMGYEWSYRFDYEQYRTATMRASQAAAGNVNVNRGQIVESWIPRPLDFEGALAFSAFAFFFGAFGRMLLLRWRIGYRVGLILAALVVLAVIGGAYFRHAELTRRAANGGWARAPADPWHGDFVEVLLVTTCATTLGATLIWGIWYALVNLFLPKRTGEALLEWQRSLAGPLDRLARDPVTSTPPPPS